MNTIRNYFRAINPSATKLGVLTAFSLGVIGVASVVMPSSISASTLPYNDPSNIVNGGVTSVSSVISHYNSNNPSDIQSIYKAFGWTSATDFQKAVSGTLKSDGTLTVNGKIVADQASAIGRKGPADGYKDTTPKTINGKAYYMTPLSYILGFYHMSSTTSFVQMNGNTPQFVVMTDCGNAVTVRTPQYSCDMLNAKKVSDTNYQFTSNVTAKNGATLSKVVYDFGDGSATVTEASASTVVSHTYDSNKPGTYTAKVTAYFTYYGQTEVSTASACEKPITIPKPATPIYECSALSASLIDTKTNTYHFVVTYKAASGAVFKGGNINFGD
ncbi:MAG TPA: hypothetical protein VNG90_03180, partial [Candidatus Acidoferrum sp.]|nr:hypothetical protein [Candidatus Acidoferrum sp.]